MERKNHLYLIVCLLMLLIAIQVIGCGNGMQEETSATNGEGVDGLPSMLTIGTHAMGSLYNAMGSGIATVASKHTPVEVKAIATSGPIEWFPMFTTGEMDMGVLNCWDAQMGWLGESEYAAISGGKGFPARLLTNGSFSIYSVLVAEDSGIKTAEDLKGKSYILNYTGAAGITAQAKAFLANQNLTENDVNIVSVPSISDGVKAVIERRADCAGSANVGFALVEELEATRGARFLSFDSSPEAVKRAQEEFPLYPIDVEPGPGFTGVREPITMMAYDAYLIGRIDLSEEAAYAIVEAIWENNEELSGIHPRLKEWTIDRFVSEQATLPYHPGAIKFYKDKGVWTEEMDALQESLLSMEQ
ncbi:MAG TPA: TAXI family TRAP transporter solute-binding subunit [Firmicutes bacterium]|nr:TAXI family TRAP transporter solute-binding subunit [Bacillota bacterium]